MLIQNIYCVCHLSSMKNIYTADFLVYYHNDSILGAGSASPTVSTCWWFEGFLHSSFQHCRGCGRICIALHSPADCWGGSVSCWSWLFSCTPSISSPCYNELWPPTVSERSRMKHVAFEHSLVMAADTMCKWIWRLLYIVQYFISTHYYTLSSSAIWKLKILFYKTYGIPLSQVLRIAHGKTVL